MDHIDDILHEYTTQGGYSRAIRIAIGLARKTLNHYYSLTDESDVYRIAMSITFASFP